MLNLLVKVGLNAAGFDTGLRQMESRAGKYADKLDNTFRNRLASIFSTAVVVAAGKQLVDYGSKIADLSKQLNTSAEDAQAMQYAFEQSGGTLEDLTRAFAQLSRVRMQALTGDKRTGDVFTRILGISLEDLEKFNAQDLLRKVAQAVQTNSLGSDRGAVLQVLFGESGERYIPIFLSGMDDMIDRAKELGYVIRNDNVAALKEAADEVTNLKYELRSLAAESAPTINFGVKFLNDIVKAAKDTLTADPKDVKPGESGTFFMNRLAGYQVKRVTDPLIKKVTDEISSALASPFVDGATEASFKAKTGEEKAATAAAIRFRSFNLNAGSLAQIGGFVGGAGGRDAMLSIQERQLKELSEIKNNTREMGETVHLAP